MSRPHITEIPDPGPAFQKKFLHWAAQQPYCVWLDSCGSTLDRYGKFEWIAAVSTQPHAPLIQDHESLRGQLIAHPLGWLFGAFSYDYKNALEPRLRSRHLATVELPAMLFFAPEIVVVKMRGRKDWVFEQGFRADLLAEIEAEQPATSEILDFSGFQSQFSHADYIAAIESVRAHIHAGDTYELNLAQNFEANGHLPHPVALWEDLIRVSPAPFAGFARWGQKYLLSASPERFLRLQSGTLITQPIKGTAARHADPSADEAAAHALRHSLKEQAENVMIVDLSRNDLHRVCETGSVQVPHLFEVQQFPQVHHLVSTVTGLKRRDVHPLDAFHAAFPPGSMTGAPKFRTCELIDGLERSARGLYSGSLGYFAPGGDFDFNVVIRSLVYDDARRKLSYHVGGAITWDSNAEAEYAETLVKARGIAEVMRKG